MMGKLNIKFVTSGGEEDEKELIKRYLEYLYATNQIQKVHS